MKWSKQWRETKNRDLTSQIPAIIRELFEVVPGLIQQIEEAERKAELEHQKYLEEERKRAIEEQLRQEAKARDDSKNELLQIIDKWGGICRLRTIFC